MRLSRSRMGGGGAVAVASVALGTALVLVIPSAANAAPVVSQANGQLVATSLLSQADLDNLLALKGATAVNSDASGDVTSDTPLDASAINGLIGLKAGTSDLFGSNGIIQLGAVGQYAQANDDGSSAAFSGAVSEAPSLIGVSTVTPSNVGAPSANSNAEITVGGASDPVNLDLTLGSLAASAQETSSGTQSGQFTLASAGVTVGGSDLSPVLASLRAPLETVLSAASLLGVNVADPINANGTLQLSLQDLLNAAGVANINDLPPDTNLLKYVPAAVVTVITDQVNGVLSALQADATNLGVVGLPLAAAITTAKGVIDPILTGLTGTLAGPLGTAIDALAQLDANVQTHGSNGSFTETALQLGLGSNGSIATVSLANATVGPNAGPLAVPLINPHSAGIAGGLGLLGFGAWAIAALWSRRRRHAALAGTAEYGVR